MFSPSNVRPKVPMIWDEPNSFRYFIEAPKSETQNLEYSQILTSVNKYSRKSKKLRSNYSLFLVNYHCFPFYTKFNLFICKYTVQILFNGFSIYNKWWWKMIKYYFNFEKLGKIWHYSTNLWIKVYYLNEYFNSL